MALVIPDGGDPIVAETALSRTSYSRMMVFSADELRALLEVAEQSPTRRVVLHDFGLKIQLREASGGFRYETCKLVCERLTPERPVIDG